MKNTNRGFTLLELVIVVMILTIMAGIGGRMWIGMEKVSRLAKTNLSQTTQAEIVFEHLRTDIAASIQAQTSDDALLTLTQIQVDFTDSNDDIFKKRMVRYVIIDDELVRELGDKSEQVITKMNGAQLAVSIENNLVRLEWRRPGVERPGQRRGQQLMILAALKGAVQ